MLLLGYDIGTSSVKAALVDAQTGKTVASAQYPDSEAPILAKQPGWAEQDPEMWWEELKQATARAAAKAGGSLADVKAIGISYQMHGLVCVDKAGKPLRPSIIWCDGRAVPYGNKAFEGIGGEKCLQHLLNSPGNFTAAKLAWVKENEPEIFAQIDKIMLPGDYIAMKLSGGDKKTTVSGLSEGMFWDFKNNEVSKDVMNFFGFSNDLIAEIVPTFSVQSTVCQAIADELGIPAGTPISYRGGDQPNNALSLNVMKPGEIAATGGTSGVVYGVLGEVNYDKLSRVNTFAHVNHGEGGATRLGVLLCINGTGICNAWMRRTVAPEGMSYPEMNDLAESVPVGAEGLSVIPFGNGAERVLQNENVGMMMTNMNFRFQRILRKTSFSFWARQRYCFLICLWHGNHEGHGYGNQHHQGWSCQYVPQSTLLPHFGNCHRSHHRALRDGRFCGCSIRRRYRCRHLQGQRRCLQDAQAQSNDQA